MRLKTLGRYASIGLAGLLAGTSLSSVSCTREEAAFWRLAGLAVASDPNSSFDEARAGGLAAEYFGDEAEHRSRMQAAERIARARETRHRQQRNVSPNEQLFNSTDTNMFFTCSFFVDGNGDGHASYDEFVSKKNVFSQREGQVTFVASLARRYRGLPLTFELYDQENRRVYSDTSPILGDIREKGFHSSTFGLGEYQAVWRVGGNPLGYTKVLITE